jgi:hypothetical protein
MIKKVLIADLVKAAVQEVAEEQIDIIPDATISSSIGSITHEYDEDNENYVVTISFNRGGSAEYIMDIDQLESWLSNPSGGYYNANVRGN